MMNPVGLAFKLVGIVLWEFATNIKWEMRSRMITGPNKRWK